MIDLAPPGLLDRLVARKALGKTPPSVTKLSHRETPLLNPSKDCRPFLPRPAKMIPVKQIAMVHDAGIDASAPEPPGKDILAGNDARIRKLASPRLEGQNQSTEACPAFNRFRSDLDRRLGVPDGVDGRDT